MWWRIILFLMMSWVIVAAFIFPAPQQVLGDASRIFYFHVPQAWVAVLAFLVSLVMSVKYLRRGNPDDDDRARVSAELGLLFCLLATITGSIFAKATWNSYWNWDPRETSIFILLLIYGAYFALRSAVADDDKLAAAYAVFAFVTVPFLIFVVPRVTQSLHPSNSIVDSSGKITLSGSTAAVFIPSLIAFTLLFFWLYRIGVRLCIKRRANSEEESYDI